MQGWGDGTALVTDRDDDARGRQEDPFAFLKK
jgi:hypothetical protein